MITERGVKIGWMKAGIAAVAVVATLLLVACSSGGDAPEAPPTPPTDPTNPTEPTTQGTELTMGLSASATPFVDAAKAAESQNGARQQAMRRSWTPPSGYFLYGDIYDDKGNFYVNFANSDLTNKSIDAFFTLDNDHEPAALPSSNPAYLTKDFYPYHGRLRYMSTTTKWRLSINKVDPDNIPSGDYYVYGFIPSDAADGATITKLSGDFKNGATLTITGLRTAGYDACVIIGAREGFDIDHDGGYTDTNENGEYDEGTDSRTNRIVAGDFKFNLKTGDDVKNYLYLLFDHLCSAVTIGIQVDGDYNTLRTIKLTEMTLQTATETGLMDEKANVEVELKANTLGINPITKAHYEPASGGAKVYQSDEGVELTTSYKSFLSHFLPIEGVTKLVITSTYDVYDKKGNLVRKGCKATNTIRLSGIITNFRLFRGWKYTINMTVKPTYLYVMSEPDLNDPTVVVN